MADERSRGLERAFEESPNDLGAQAAVLRDQVRRGVLRLGYSFVPERGHANSYGVGLRLLRDAVPMLHLIGNIHPGMNVGSRFVARPLTFKETILARIANYVQNGNKHVKADLFSQWVDTCTAIVYKKDSWNFRIIPLSSLLVSLPEEFNKPFVDFEYDSLFRYDEFDQSDGRYNRLLTREEVSTHPAWLAAVEGDRALLDTYADIVFARRSEAMCFWTIDRKPKTNELRALCADYLGGGCSCLGGRVLSGGARFARVRPL